MKVRSSLLAISILLSVLFSCSNADKKDSADTSSASQSGLSSYDAGETIKIGLQADMTGDVLMPAAYHAVEIAVDQINKSGGVLGKPIEMIKVDTQGDTQRYQEMTKKLLYEDNVSIMFGSGLSSAREAMRPLLENAGVLYYYMTGYEGGLASDYMLMGGPSPGNNVKPMVEYAAKNIGKSMYIVAPDYNYGHLTALWIQKYCKENGIEVLGTEFVGLGEAQYATTINNIQRANPDMVWTMLVSTPEYSFFDQWISYNLDITLISATNFGGDTLRRDIAAPGLSGTYYTATFIEDMAKDNEAAADFIKLWRSYYPDEEVIGDMAWESYYAVYMWKNAVEAAGSCDPKAVLKAVENGDCFVETFQGKVGIDPQTHQAMLPNYIYRINDDHSVSVVDKQFEVVDRWILDELHIDLTQDGVDPRELYTLESLE